jgi:hypothetical protein
MKHQDGTAALVKALSEGLTKSHAHLSLEDALKGLPVKARGIRPEGMPYSIWQLLEHIRITQWDIVAFSAGPDHKSPVWPKGYWTAEAEPPSASAWTECIHQIHSEQAKFIGLLESPDADLFTPFSYGEGQNLVREAILLIDHTSYHVGEILALRRMLGNWKAS